MAKKRFWLGILAMALVFGVMVVGCEKLLDGAYTYTFVNASSSTVTVSCGDLNPSQFTINTSSTRTATSSKDAIQIMYMPSDKVNAASNSGTFTFTNK